MNLLTTTSLLILLIGCNYNPCNQVVAAFDIGSASTKMVVAKVNICTNSIDEILTEPQTHVAYKESLQKSRTFENKIVTLGIESLKKLKIKAQEFSPITYYAVATEAFRNAANSEEVTHKIKRATGLSIKVLTQKEEAELGFLAARAHANGNKILSWDIGGGSMQISDGKTIYQGKLASVTFKNLIISKIQKGKGSSPNPMSTNDEKLALKLVKSEAKRSVPKELKIKTTSHQVIGVGSVHYYCIKRQTDKSTYTQEDLTQTIARLHGKNDSELGGEYASTDFSNLYLVLGFMEELGIDKVKVAKANLAHGLLLNHTVNTLSFK